MYIGSHLERCVLVQTAELYSPGKYVNWNFPVQVKSGMYIGSHIERCVLVQTAELYSPGKYVNWNFNFFNGNPMLAMEQSPLCGRTGTVHVKSGMYIDSHFERCVLVQTAELYSPGKYVNLNFNFFNGNPMLSYGEFFKGPCAAVQELYRSSLVCTLVPILKGVYWSKQQSCSVLGSM